MKRKLIPGIITLETKEGAYDFYKNFLVSKSTFFKGLLENSKEDVVEVGEKEFAINSLHSYMLDGTLYEDFNNEILYLVHKWGFLDLEKRYMNIILKKINNEEAESVLQNLPFEIIKNNEVYYEKFLVNFLQLKKAFLYLDYIDDKIRDTLEILLKNFGLYKKNLR
jgi:hypothetical protein